MDLLQEAPTTPLPLTIKTFYCNNISQYYYFYSMFGQINPALVRIKHILQKQKLLTDPNLVYVSLYFYTLSF